MGGTFDHLHEGHKYLIRTALSFSKKVAIGLTTQKLIKNKKFPSKIEEYKIREKNIKNFVSTFTDLKRVEILELNDPYGPPVNEPEYEGLIVSQETYQVALKMNEIRENKGLKPMIIIVIPMLKDKDNKRLSSTSIREKLS